MKKAAKILLILSLVLAVLALVWVVGVTLFQRVYALQSAAYNANYGAAGYKWEAWRTFFSGNFGDLRQYVLPVGYLAGTLIQVVIVAVIAFGMGKKKGTGMEKLGLILLCGWGLILLGWADNIQYYLHLMVPALRPGLMHFNGMYEPLKTVTWLLRVSSLLAVMGCGLSLGTKVEKAKKGAAVWALILFLVAMVGGAVGILLQAYTTEIRSLVLDIAYSGTVIDPYTLERFFADWLPERLSWVEPFETYAFAVPVGMMLLALVQLVLTCLCLIRFKGKGAPMVLAILFAVGVLLGGAFVKMEDWAVNMMIRAELMNADAQIAYNELRWVLQGTVNLSYIAAILCAGGLCTQAAFRAKNPVVK